MRLLSSMGLPSERKTSSVMVETPPEVGMDVGLA